MELRRDAAAVIDEMYPLHLQAFERSRMCFGKARELLGLGFEDTVPLRPRRLL